MPIQADFILRRLHEMAEADPALRDAQPWKAAHERDFGWFGDGARRALRRRRHEPAHARWAASSPRTRGSASSDFEAQARRVPARRRSTRRSAAATSSARYAPMVELLRLPGGERLRELHRLGRRPRLHAADQRRAVRHPARPGDRQLDSRSSTSATTRAARSRASPRRTYLDDGPQKPVRIWSRVGRRPILAAGNSNGDIADARLHPASGQAVPAPARPPRRRRARVRLHRRRRAGARSGAARRAGPWSASGTTGARSSPARRDRRRHDLDPARASSGWGRTRTTRRRRRPAASRSTASGSTASRRRTASSPRSWRRPAT